MWNLLLMIIFLVSDLSVKAELNAEQSFYDHNHGHLSAHGPGRITYNGHHINSVNGYFHSEQPQLSHEQQPQQHHPHPVNYELQPQPHPVNYEQQPQPHPVNVEQQQGPISVTQLDPNNHNINFTSNPAHPVGYWPTPHGGFPHHPGFYPNGGITYRTEPPNLSLFGHNGFSNSATATTTPTTPTRNNVQTRQQFTIPKDSPAKRPSLKRFQEKKNPTRKSQTLPKRKSQTTEKPQKRRKLVDFKSNRNDNQRVFNFSYIPEELLDKGFPIHPTLEIVRDEQGIPIVVPVFRPLPESYNNKSRKQTKKSQRQQENPGQQPLIFQNGAGFSYNQGPFAIQLSPFSNQLNNPLSSTNGFVSRDVQPETVNLTGQPLGVNFGWGSPLPIVPFHPLVHHSVPYPYSHFGWGPVYINATQAQAVETPPSKKSQKSEVKVKPTKAAPTKSKSGKENTTEEKDEESEDGQVEHGSNENDEMDTPKKNKTAGKNHNHEDDYEDDYQEDDKTMEDDMTNNRNQNSDEDDSANEVEDDNDYNKENENEKEELMKMKPVAVKDEENYLDTEEVREEIPSEVLKQMIQEYNDNENNKDTPIVLEGDQGQHVVDRLRNQIQSLLDAFALRPKQLAPNGRNYTADDIDWNTRLRERYQLKTRPAGPTILR